MMIEANQLNRLKQTHICYVSQDHIIISYRSLFFQLSREAKTIDNLSFVKKALSEDVLKERRWIDVIQFDCVYGVVQLQNTVALILVLKGIEVTKINKKAVYQVQETKIVYVNNIRNDPFSSAFQLSFKLFKTYYSHDLDLSLRLQCQYENSHSENRYISNFNNSLKYGQYPKQLITVCISGLVKKFTYELNDSTITITLISRANTNRIGRRWYRRGIDNEANTANEYQSQLIWEVVTRQTRTLYSYVQIRGSIPLFWQETAGISKIQISENKERNNRQIAKYLERIAKNYGNVTFLNLIEKRGREKNIGALYKRSFEQANIKNTHFMWFDFGGQYKAKNQNAFKQLMLQLSRVIDQQIFEVDLLGDKDFNIKNKQTKVIRTNCMDCLDRTNYVQNLISKYVAMQLEAKLLGCPKINAFPFIFHSEQLQNGFKMLWRENGFAISKQYSGTPPMKGDFLQSNKRTLKGKLVDSVVGSKRIYLGYYFDSYYQNCIDLHFNKINFQRDGKQFSPSLHKNILQLFAFCGVINFILKVIAFPLMLKDKIVQKCKDRILQYASLAGASLAGFVFGGMVTKFGYKYLLQLPISRKYEQL